MKNKLIIVLTVVSIIFAAMFIKSYSSYNSLSNKYSISMANNKAYQSQLDTVNNKSRVFQFKANQLAYLNDSIVGKLKEVQSYTDADLKTKAKKISGKTQLTLSGLSAQALKLSDGTFVSNNKNEIGSDDVLTTEEINQTLYITQDATIL